MDEKGSVKVVRKWRIRRSQKYTTIGVIQEIAFMAKLLKRSQAV